MRKIREILRLKYECGRSNRDIGQSCGIGSSTVSEYLQRVRMAGLAWPLPEGLSDQALEQRLFPPPISRDTARLLPDFHEIHNELQSRRGVTLNLLWQEYKEQHPDGYQYSWFCQHYRAWSARLDVVMRHEHRAGEKLFVDYAGQTREVIDPATGAIRQAQIFVAVLGASNYTYAEATWSQQIEDWIGSHVRALAFFGGVPEAIVPDNLKSGVNKACLYVPDINPTYHDLARHYQTVVLPARVRKPRDKAKAEAGVLLVERWILARLRKHTFFSLAELNREITRLLQRLNSIQDSVRAWLPDAAPLTVADALRLCANAPSASEDWSEAAPALAEEALEALMAAREREGKRLATMLLDRLKQLRALASQAGPLVPQLVEQQRQRFMERWKEAMALTDGSTLPEAARDRALTEATAFAIRIDVAEEITRLDSHLDEIERLLKKGGEVGKRLDFLIQELHREANTLGSKSAALDLTRISVDMKVLIEQMREQVQNIE